MPTRFTRRTGTLSVVAAALWLATAGLWWVAGLAPPRGEVTYNSLDTASGILYAIGAATLLGAAVLTLITLLALDRRHGGLGMVGRVGLVFSALGVIGALAAWVFMGWGLLLTIGTLLVAYAMLGRDIAPRLPTWALGGGLAAGTVSWVVLRSVAGTLLQWGGLWGGFWIANLVGVTVAAALLAYGLLGLGVWMRGETQVVITPDPDPAVIA